MLIQFKDGKVDAYGRLDDFDSTKHKELLIKKVEAIKQHLAAGTDVNVKNKDRDTPLHKPALNGHKEIVDLLIAKRC